MTCILLHNFLRKSNSSVQIYTPPGTIDTYDPEGVFIQPGSWRTDVDDNGAIRPLPQRGRRPAPGANQIREEFATFFLGMLIRTVNTIIK